MANFIQIEKYLMKQKIPYEIIDLGGEVFRVEDVVKVGIKAEEIVKTLIVRCEKDSIRGMQTKYVALALRGGDRLDFKKVRRIFGGKATLASADEVKKVIGVPIGAVCPIQVGISVYLDKLAMSLVKVNMGSGDLTKGLDMKFADLLKAIGEYVLADLTLRPV